MMENLDTGLPELLPLDSDVIGVLPADYGRICVSIKNWLIKDATFKAEMLHCFPSFSQSQNLYDL